MRRSIGSDALASALAALALCVSRAAFAADPVVTNVDREGSVLQVRSILVADAPATTCYAVLADLDRLADFVPRMKSSRVISPPGQPTRLHQVGDASTGFFHVIVDVTLDVKADPPRRLEFHRVAGNLREMQGSWTVTGDARRCEIRYFADIEPEFWVPPLIGAHLAQEQIEEQLRGLLAEIDRRARAARPIK